MSIPFSDTSTYKGLIQIYEKEIGAKLGDISGNSTKLKEVTADINLAYDEFVWMAIRYSGLWQFDDSNQTDYPIITTSLVASQRDYAFTTDGSSNLILDVYRVLVKDTSGVYQEIKQKDQNQNDSNTNNTISFVDGNNTTGTPTAYDILGNSIFLDPIPSYNSSAGLKVFVNREPSYFISSDTTKKPGVPGIFHKYFALKAALDYARRNTLSNYQNLLAEVLRYEGDESRGLIGMIESYYALRNRGIKRGMRFNVENTH